MKRSTRLILLVIALVLLLGAAGTALGLWTKGLADAASRGKAQIMAGAKSLASQDVTAADPQFSAASQTFASAKRSLGPGWFAAAVRPIPWLGRQYAAAQTLVEIGLDGSAAGTQLTEVLQRASVASSTSDPAGRFASILAIGHRNVESALASLSDAADRASTLPTEGLIPPLARDVNSVKAALSSAAPLLSRSRGLLQLESYLLSSNHRLLVVSQDGAELRPTGGFVGSFGVIDVGPAGVRLETYKDVYALPDPPGRIPPPPGEYMTNDFSFRDANWWIDFPTSAKAMLTFWRDYRQPPVDGIIAIDTVVMKWLLGVVGPIHVPSYGETFSSANLLNRLLYLVETQYHNGPGRKGVLVALASELEKRVLEASPADLARSTLVLGKAADEKHVQAYFADPHAQAAVEALGWSGRVAMATGTTDLLAISNAMNQGGKVNMAMKKTIHYDVALQSDKSAETTLVLGYASTGAYLPIPSTFRNWLRVYRAPGTVFPGKTPDGSTTKTTVEFGLPAEVRMFTLLRGRSRTETLVARVPRALTADASAAAGRNALHYRLHMVRQDDLQDIPTEVEVTTPAGYGVSSANAKLTASGAALPVTTSRDGARVAIPQTGDFDLDVLVTSP